MNIFVSGSLRNVPAAADHCHGFVEQLATQIIDRGHTLLTGCRGSLDSAIAEAAYAAIVKNGLDPRKHLISYRLKNEERAHQLGRVLISRLTDWELTHAELHPPEQIAEADVAVFVAGRKGTLLAANWARIAEKPVLGVAQFGGAGEKLFERERDRFRKRYAQFVDIEEFDILSEDTDDCTQLAEDVVKLCERVLTPNNVFTIMPFTDEFRDVYDSYREVCGDFGLNAERTDDSDSSERIIPRILDGIRRSAFVIADVTTMSPNVFYEIGFAEGFSRLVIVTAKEGTELPFDLADIPVLFWKNQNELREKLRRRMGEVVVKLKRARSAF
jgi:hypothetical protein